MVQKASERASSLSLSVIVTVGAASAQPAGSEDTYAFLPRSHTQTQGFYTYLPPNSLGMPAVLDAPFHEVEGRANTWEHKAVACLSGMFCIEVIGTHMSHSLRLPTASQIGQESLIITGVITGIEATIRSQGHIPSVFPPSVEGHLPLSNTHHQYTGCHTVITCCHHGSLNNTIIWCCYY